MRMMYTETNVSNLQHVWCTDPPNPPIGLQADTQCSADLTAVCRQTNVAAAVPRVRACQGGGPTTACWPWPPAAATPAAGAPVWVAGLGAGCLTRGFATVSMVLLDARIAAPLHSLAAAARQRRQQQPLELQHAPHAVHTRGCNSNHGRWHSERWDVHSSCLM